MSIPTHQLDLLLELEARHDDLIQRLEDLDERTSKVLADCLVIRQPTPACSVSLPVAE